MRAPETYREHDQGQSSVRRDLFRRKGPVSGSVSRQVSAGRGGTLAVPNSTETMLPVPARLLKALSYKKI